MLQRKPLTLYKKHIKFSAELFFFFKSGSTWEIYVYSYQKYYEKMQTPIEGEHGPITPHLVKHACRYRMCHKHTSVFGSIMAELKIGTSKKS